MNVMRSASGSPDDSNVKVDMGEAQVVSKKKRKNKTKKGKGPNQQPRLSEDGAPNRATHALVTEIGALDAGVNFIYFLTAQANGLRRHAKFPFFWESNRRECLSDVDQFGRSVEKCSPR